MTAAEILQTPELAGLLRALLLVAGSLAAALLARTLFGAVARRAGIAMGQPLDDGLLRRSRAAVSLFVLALGLREAIKAAGGTGRTAGAAEKGLLLLAALTALLVGIRSYQQLIAWYGRRLAERGDAESATLERDFLPLLHWTGIVVLALVVLSVVLAQFGQSIGSLLVSLGVGSLALGLAAQDALANMIAGLVILIDRPFRSGDRLELSPGQIGEVVDIGIRSTRLRLLDGTMLVAPNADLVKSRLLVTPGETTPSIQVRLHVAHGCDPAAAKRLAVEAAAASPHVLPDPAPKALLLEIQPSAMVVLLLAWIRDLRSRGDALDDVHGRLVASFREGDVRLAYPVTEVRFGTPLPALSAP